MNTASSLLRSSIKFTSLFFPAFLILLAGCGSSKVASISQPTSPTSPTQPASPSQPASPGGPTLTAIAVTPPGPTISVNSSTQVKATGSYSDGSSVDLTNLATWSSSNSTVAEVSKAGVITGDSGGDSTITASMNGQSGSTVVSVIAGTVTVKSITLAPPTASISVGGTQQFVANAVYSDGNQSALGKDATWTSSNNGAATVDATGLATGVAAGTTTISVTSGGVTATAALTITAAPKTLTALAITPATATVIAGAIQQFTASATYSDGSRSDVSADATWSSSSATVATVNGGSAKGLSAGTSSISATLSGQTATSTLTVNAASITGLAISPSTPDFQAGSTEQFTATASYNNGTTADVTSTATWTSSNTAAATISPAGLATGVAAGTTTITAAINGTTASTLATVTTTPPVTAGTVDITTWHVDQNRSGLNSRENILTPSTVTASKFGKLFSYLVDGYVYGSPLIKSNVSLNGTTHNVMYVATERDSVYALDADNYGTGAPLWKVSLLATGESPLTSGPIKPFEGVTSTPVIDPATNTLYVVSAQTAGSGGFFRLSALDITTGAQKFGGPVTISASVPATNSAAVNGVETLSTSCIQRAALLLANGNIYIGFGGCHSGWLLAYSASTLKQVGVFNSSTILNGEGKYASAGGVWMGGGGPVADSNGNIYISTGNGPWDGKTAWADSILKFGPTPQGGPNGTMQPVDYFTPSVYQFMDCFDADLAGGGLLMIPGSTRIIAGGKTGIMYVVDGANLGHETSNDAGAIQQTAWGAGLSGGSSYQQTCTDAAVNTANIASYEIFGTSDYFNGNVYLGVTPTSPTAPAGVRQFGYSGQLSLGSDSANYQLQGTRGTSPFISANGTSGGIVWMIDQGSPLQNTSGTTPSNAILRAYDAASYPNALYDSNINSADKAGYGIKFSSPVVANGKVFVPAGHDLPTATDPQGEIDVYGLK